MMAHEGLVEEGEEEFRQFCVWVVLIEKLK
jgi:hypothetical protein